VTYWSKSFAGLAECVAEVRGCINKVLGDREGVDLVELVVSELAGNAIRHSGSGDPGGQFTVHLAEFVDRWRIRVDDEGGPSVPHVCTVPLLECIDDLDRFDAEVEVGRGLALVAAVSATWGVLGGASARAVWAEILIPRSSSRLWALEPAAPATEA